MFKYGGVKFKGIGGFNFVNLVVLYFVIEVFFFDCFVLISGFLVGKGFIL